jgi:putative membrane protein
VKYLARIALPIGVAVMVILVIREGAQSIAGLLRQAGPLLLLLVPLHIVPLLLDAAGWRVLIFDRTRLSSLFSIAAIREAINRLLPVANVGGELVGIRMLARQGVSGTTAVSSVMVELLLNIVAQYVFLALGLGILLRITGSVRATGALLIAVASALPVLLLLMWLLSSGRLLRALEEFGARMLSSNTERSNVLTNLAQLDAAVRRLTSAHGRMALATVWQLAALIAGSSETWLALRWLGHPLSLASALAIESVTLAARSLIFVAPAGLGVQEAGLVAVGHLLGLGSDVAIALSLAKRMREILFGVPALVAWQLGSRKGVVSGASLS